MIVITRNGQTTIITGWRAWLISFGVFIMATLIFAVIAFFMLGVAVTFGAIMLIVIPAAIFVAGIGALFRRRV